MATQDILRTVSRRAILAAGIGLILILLGATTVVLVVLRNEALARAEWHLGSLATALSEQTWQSVRAIELLARTAADEIKDHHLEKGKGGPPDRQLHQIVRERMAMLPNVRVVAFAGPRGEALLHSSAYPPPALSFGDREYFQAHLKRRIEGLHVGEPVIGRLTREWMNVFSVRVEDSGGEFRGVVAAAVHMPYFENLFGALNLGKGGRVFLFRDDGVLLAVHPATERVLGRTFVRDPVFKGMLTRGATGVQRRPGLLDEEPRILAFGRLTGYPLIVAVSSTEDAILIEWRRDAWRIGIGALVAAAFIGIALFFLLRQARVSAEFEQDLQETSQRLHAIIHSAMDAIITTDERQNIVQFNEAAEKIFRCPAAEAVGGPLGRFIPERFRAAHHAHVERFGATGLTSRAMGASLDLRGLRADGEEFPLDASISQVEAQGKKFFTVILRDITERKAAEVALDRSFRELRDLSAALHEVREAERLRIARELHDELAQWLTAIKMDISWLASRLPKAEAHLADKTEKMKALVDTTVASVRRIAADLRPVMLDDLGLVATMEHLLHDLSQRTGMVVSLEADASQVEIGEPVASSLYRMAQEALTNVARHAAATEVRMSLRVEDGWLVLAVRDNGRGFDAAAAARRKSYGVLGIRERAQTLGGTARIERLAAGGTLVEIAIPVGRYRKGETRHDTGVAG